jgi:hypothetical protein
MNFALVFPVPIALNKRANSMPDKLTIIRPEAKRGRKQALATVSEQQITEAEDAMKLGFPQSRVAGLLGISEAALSRAMKRDDGIGERLQRAKAEGIKNNLAVIQTHAAKSWQAAAWILERTAGFAQPSTQPAQNVQINLQNVLASQAKRPAEQVKVAKSPRKNSS